MLKTVLFSILSISTLNAQQIDTDSILKNDTIHKFKFERLVIPAVLIGYGIVSIESDQLKLFNTQIRDEVKEDIDKTTTIDDFSQYAPALSVYGLNALGIKGKHNFKDRTILLGTSYLIMSASVLSLADSSYKCNFFLIC